MTRWWSPAISARISPASFRDGVDVGRRFIGMSSSGLRSTARMKAISCFGPRADAFAPEDTNGFQACIEAGPQGLPVGLLDGCRQPLRW